jgi:hypothetical protein
MPSVASPEREKVVPVRAYTRFRFGALESVVRHLRSLPRARA